MRAFPLLLLVAAVLATPPGAAAQAAPDPTPLPGSTPAAEVPAPDTTAAEAATETRSGRLTLIPIVFRSPDTGWAFGALPQYIFRTTPETRPSRVRLDGYYTQKGQYSFQFVPRLWLPGNRYYLQGRIAFREWPTTFYGIGNDTPEERRERYTPRTVRLQAEVLHQLRPGLFVGARYGLERLEMLARDPEGALVRGTIAGSDGGRSAGAGLSVSWDTRDDVLFPRAGSWHQASFGWSSPWIASQYAFTSYQLDLRHYRSVARRQVVAAQLTVRLRAGTVPFQTLSGVGQVLRGYSSARYVDQQLVGLQAEYRFVPVVWRVGFAVFAGAAQVAPTPADFSLPRFKPSAGVGLRFQLFRSEQIHLRFDFAVGQGASGDYLDILEAF